MRAIKELIEYRCQCGKLLCKGKLFLSEIEIKCKRCGRLTAFDGQLPSHIPHMFLVRDGEELPDKLTRLKMYNGSNVAGFRIYIFDKTNENLLL